MDFAAIKKKMRNNQYKKRDEFLHDVELILNNCEYFNEDDSPVGQAGHFHCGQRYASSHGVCGQPGDLAGKHFLADLVIAKSH